MQGQLFLVLFLSSAIFHDTNDHHCNHVFFSLTYSKLPLIRFITPRVIFVERVIIRNIVMKFKLDKRYQRVPIYFIMDQIGY